MELLQEVLAFIVLGIALVYLFRKFFWKKKEKKSCGHDECNLH